MPRKLFESAAFLVANHLPRMQWFDRHRWIVLRMGGGRFESSTIWAPIDVRPIGGLRNLSIGAGTFVNAGLRCGVPDGARISIGRNCAIGPNVSFETVNHNFSYDSSVGWGGSAKSIEVQDRVWIGSGSIVLQGVVIGHDTVIAAGSVVTKSVPPNSVYGGIPAKSLRPLMVS